LGLGLGLGLLGLGCCEHHRFSRSCHVYESVAKDKNGVAGWLVGSQSVMFSCMFCVSGIGSVGFRDLGSEFVGYLPICLSAYLLTYLPTFTEGVGVGGGVIGVGGWVFLGVMDGFMAGWSGWLARGPGSKQHRPPFCAAEFYMRFDLAVLVSVSVSVSVSVVSGFGSVLLVLFRRWFPFSCCMDERWDVGFNVWCHFSIVSYRSSSSSFLSVNIAYLGVSLAQSASALASAGSHLPWWSLRLRCEAQAQHACVGRRLAGCAPRAAGGRGTAEQHREPGSWKRVVGSWYGVYMRRRGWICGSIGWVGCCCVGVSLTADVTRDRFR
jgi:hypothetical protein